MKKIILHIGSPKCGSTYLQRALLQSNEALKAAGIHYPHAGGTHLGNAADIADLGQQRLDRYFEGNTHTVILSHEDLYSLSDRGDALQQLARRNDIPVQIVVFLRPFSEFMFGDYSQFMKQHFDRYLAERNPYDGRSFEDFVHHRANTMKPAGFIRRWARRFPDLPPVVASHRNIRAVFETLLGQEAPINWDVHATQTNPSLRMQDCDAIAAAMRDRSVDPTTIRGMFRQAFHDTAEPDSGKTDARKKWIEEQFRAQNAALMRHFDFDNRLRLPQ